MKRTNLAIWIVCLIFAGAGTVFIGNFSGKHVADEVISRLQVLWPSVLSFPETDRAFLAGLSMTCHLNEKEKVRETIIECLRSAANNPNALLPKGDSPSDANDRLERLLSITTPR